MADTNTLKEFLVALGFKVDKNGLKNFTDAVTKTTTRVVELGAAVQLAATAVALAVTKIADEFEDLYYMSQRVNSSAENIKAFSFAMSQLGSSSEEARGALEGVASFIRSNPSGENFLRGLIGETRDVNGNLLDTENYLERLGAKFKTETFAVAKLQASMLGISENALIALMRGPSVFVKQYYAYADKIGVNLKDMTEKGHDFMVELRNDFAELSLVLYKIAGPLFPKITAWLERLRDKLGDNADVLTDRLLPVLEKFLRFAEHVGEVLLWIVDRLLALDAATGGWSTKLLTLIAVLKFTGVLSVITSLVGAFGKLAASIFLVDSAAVALPLLAAVAGAAIGAALLTTGVLVYNHWKEIVDFVDNAISHIRATYNDVAEFAHLPHWGAGASGSWEAPAGAVTSKDRTERTQDMDSLLGLVRRLEGSGDTSISRTGAVGRYQIEPGTARQYGFDANKLGDPAYNEQVARTILADLSSRYGGDTSAILSAYNAGPGRANKFVAADHDVSTLPAETRRYLERAAAYLGAGGSGARLGGDGAVLTPSSSTMNSYGGAKNVTVSQKTEIHVSGSDHLSVGPRVAAEQKTVNANLFNNLRTSLN